MRPVKERTEAVSNAPYVKIAKAIDDLERLEKTQGLATGIPGLGRDRLIGDQFWKVLR